MKTHFLRVTVQWIHICSPGAAHQTLPLFFLPVQKENICSLHSLAEIKILKRANKKQNG